MKYFVSSLLISMLLLGILSRATAFAQTENTANISAYKNNFDLWRPLIESLEKKGLTLMDYHVHIMKDGMMTPETVCEYARYTGLRIGILENAGRKWILSNNAIISTWLDEAEKAAYKDDPNKKAFLIGIQVNDRDWYKIISPENIKRIDYVLADTLVMVKPDGSPLPLWELPEDYDVDPEVWMNEYFKHCMTVLDEPITIWADPLYLPVFCRDKADQLWTLERMDALIDKVVENNIAIEIQGPSSFPLDKFIPLAIAKGAKFCLGTNNFDDKPKSMENWKWFFDNYRISNDQLIRLEPKKHVSR